MIGHLVIGSTGTGKTNFIKNMISKINNKATLIYDIQNEYGVGKPGDFDLFAERATRLQNAFIVFEEATIFLDSRGSNKRLKEVLVSKRHTNNYVVLVFHSIADVPKYIFRICTHCTLFKTLDDHNQIKFHHPNLIKAHANLLTKDKGEFKRHTFRLY